MKQEAADRVLRRFRQALEAMYGDRPERVVLFGSRARGDARPDYETGPGSEVSQEQAADAIAENKRFVARMLEMIEAP